MQAALKLVLEPIFEADFQPCSYGFRPGRRAQDAIAEIHQLASRSYEWVLEGDIAACFDEIDHTALMDRVRRRVGDKRVLALGQGVPARPASSARTASSGTPSPAPPKGGSCPRCWPTSPCRSSTSTSPRPGRRQRHLPAAPGGASGAGQLAARPLRGRLRGDGGRHQGARRGAAGGGGGGAGPDGAAPVRGEDEDLPHRRGLRLPRVPHPAATEARHGQALGLHLPVQEGLGRRSRRRCAR